MSTRKLVTKVVVAGAASLLALLVLPLPAQAHPAAKASARVTISGRAHWTIFLGAIYVQSGYRAGCGATNGALTLWGGTTARKLAVISRKPVVEQHKVDSEGDVTWLCHMDYTVHAPREPKYAIAWNNGTPYDNYGCSNSKARSDAKIWTQPRTAGSHRVSTIGFSYLCTDDGY